MRVIDRVRPKLLTLDQVREVLATTEPLETVPLNEGSNIKFLLDEGWALELDAAKPDDIVPAEIVVNGERYKLTKEAALQAGAAFGLTGAYVKKAPAKLVEPHLNYWYGAGLGSNAFNLLTKNGNEAYAFAKPTTQPFSNLELLDAVLGGISVEYGGEILADFKFCHSLAQTDIRLIFLEELDVVKDSEMFDVRDEDYWSYGVHISNSLIGKSMTSVEPYFFRWWGQSGLTADSGAGNIWNRKSQGQNETLVREWAWETALDILAGDALNRIRHLTQLKIDHNLGEVLDEVFTMHKVPVSQRSAIIEEISSVDGDATMYHLQQAISRTANDSTITADRADRLMRIAGSLSSSVFDPLKAKIWREGNLAPRGAASPYEIVGA